MGASRKRRGLIAAGLVCALAGLAGCGGDKADAAKQDESLEEQIGLDDDGIRLKQTNAENLIRDCMKAQGFDYVPVDPAAQQAALTGTPGMSKDDFEKQYGYGITTLYEQRRQLAVAGPNKALRDSLGEADRKAYDQALYGDDPTATFVDALDTGDYSRLGGCIKTATEQVFGGADVLSGPVGEARRARPEDAGRLPHGEGRAGVVGLHARKPASTGSRSRKRSTRSSRRSWRTSSARPRTSPPATSGRLRQGRPGRPPEGGGRHGGRRHRRAKRSTSPTSRRR